MFFPTASNSWFAFPAVEVALGCKSPHHADGEGQGQTPWFGSSRLGQRGLGYWKQERDSRSLVFQQLPEGLHVHYFYNSSLVLSTWIIQFTVVTDIFNYWWHWLWQSHAPMFNIWFLASHIYPGTLFQFPSHPCHEEEKGLTDNRRGLVLRDWASGWDWLETVPALLSSFYICSMFTLWVYVSTRYFVVMWEICEMHYFLPGPKSMEPKHIVWACRRHMWGDHIVILVQYIAVEWSCLKKHSTSCGAGRTCMTTRQSTGAWSRSRENARKSRVTKKFTNAKNRPQLTQVCIHAHCTCHQYLFRMNISKIVCCRHPPLCLAMPLINLFGGLWAIPFYSCIQATGEPTGIWTRASVQCSLTRKGPRSRRRLVDRSLLKPTSPPRQDNFIIFNGFSKWTKHVYIANLSRFSTWWNKALLVFILSSGRSRMLWLVSWSLSWQRLVLWESWSVNLKANILTRLLRSFLVTFKFTCISTYINKRAPTSIQLSTEASELCIINPSHTTLAQLQVHSDTGNRDQEGRCPVWLM